MKVSYNWLESFFNKKLPEPEKLADLLTQHVFETELIQTSGAKHQTLNDAVLDIDVTPNRAHDCLSYWGIAKEISAILKIPFKLPDYKTKIKPDNSKSVKDLIEVQVQDKKLCPRYTARVIENVKVGSSPDWIQARLKASGLRPISNIVDIVNYAMLETGQPMHAFDYDKLKNKHNQFKKIIVRKAKTGEKIVSLDGEKYDLTENILVIADQENPVCIAGIKGGTGPGIDNQTQRIVLEAANFNPQIIRQASQELRLTTDASWRFEHDLDANLTLTAIDMAAYLIQDLAQGKVLKGYFDFYPKKTNIKQISLDPAYLRNLLGISISEKEIISILKRLDLKTVKTGTKLRISVPTQRKDLQTQEDLIEEVGRIYGFGKIPSQLPAANLIPPEINQELFYQEKIKSILAGYGYSEIYNYSFISQQDVSVFDFGQKKLIQLANPISQEQSYLRPSLLINLLKNISQNQKFFNQIKLFESGKVFYQDKEFKSLAGAISLGESNQQANEFYQLKGALDSLFKTLGLTDIWYDDAIKDQDNFIKQLLDENRQAQIKSGDQILGWIGQLDAKIANQYEIKSKTGFFELDFSSLAKLADEQKEYSPPSKYPAIVRDLALIVDFDVKVVQIMNLINSAGGKLIRDIDLFDMYQGENLPDGRKSLAFHIIYQSDEHTLTDQEVNQIHQKVIQALEKETNWEVRR